MKCVILILLLVVLLLGCLVWNFWFGNDKNKLVVFEILFGLVMGCVFWSSKGDNINFLFSIVILGDCFVVVSGDGMVCVLVVSDG